MAGKAVQARVHDALTEFVDENLLELEWSVRAGAQDIFGARDSYAPRLDIAIGPFNARFQNRHDAAAAIRHADSPLISVLRAAIIDQNPEFFENGNPRCLVGIEVEHRTSSKHILGGIVNVSMLGRLGVVIGSPGNVAKIRRIHAYLLKLKEVEKAPLDMFGNVGVFELPEFLGVLNQARE